MSDTVNKYPAVLFASIAFGFSLGLIAVVCLYGSPTNSLHSSALAWAFTTVLVVLAAYGFSAVLDLWKPKP